MAPGLEREDFMALGTYEIYANIVDHGAPSGWFSARTLAPSPPLGTRQAIIAASQQQFSNRATPEPSPTNPAPTHATSHRKVRRS
jgi:hypothetical protein